MFDKPKDKKPGQFRADEPEQKQPSAVTASPLQAAGKAAVIGPGITIDGDVSGTENLIIEGKVAGKILLASHEVTVGSSGEVNADVTAKTVRVAGKVHGDLTAKEKVIINSTGNVRGNIVTPRILLEDGAIFKGSIDMDPSERSPAQLATSAAKMAVKSGGGPELVSDSVKKSSDPAFKSG